MRKPAGLWVGQSDRCCDEQAYHSTENLLFGRAAFTNDVLIEMRYALYALALRRKLAN